MKPEMFPDEVINNLPKNPTKCLRILIKGYLDYVQDTQFRPMTHFEKCMDGYALIFAYNKYYNLGLELLSADADHKNETIQALNDSIVKIQNKFGRQSIY